jgi:cytochrome c-type protein NapC
MKSWLGKLFIGAALVLVGAALAAGFNTVIAYTNTEAFCISCHTMKINYEEYKKTAHFKNPSGVRATCADCHVPRDFGPKLLAKIMAAKDVYHEIKGTIDTPEKYEAQRWAMASAVWAKMKASDSRECRACHDYQSMALDNQGKSAKKKHARAMEQGKTCIDCHTGIAHTEPDAPEGMQKPGEGDEARAVTGQTTS